MEPEDTVVFTRVTGPYPEPDEPSAYSLYYLSKIHFNSHLLLDLHNGLFPSGFPTTYLYSSSLSYVLYTLYISSPWLHHSNNILRGVQVMKLLV
jgi:hypothetical protein